MFSYENQYRKELNRGTYDFSLATFTDGWDEKIRAQYRTELRGWESSYEELICFLAVDFSTCVSMIKYILAN